MDTPLSECEARDPMTCKYHGLKAFENNMTGLLGKLGADDRNGKRCLGNGFTLAVGKREGECVLTCGECARGDLYPKRAGHKGANGHAVYTDGLQKVGKKTRLGGEIVFVVKVAVHGKHRGDILYRSVRNERFVDTRGLCIEKIANLGGEVLIYELKGKLLVFENRYLR